MPLDCVTKVVFRSFQTGCRKQHTTQASFCIKSTCFHMINKLQFFFSFTSYFVPPHILCPLPPPFYASLMASLMSHLYQLICATAVLHLYICLPCQPSRPLPTFLTFTYPLDPRYPHLSCDMADSMQVRSVMLKL